ncbi:MAG: histidine phosphatase family protein [Gammaproteobacteria bacterium]|nr:histidine phosphatase family protein [Gammaproteobacteria bacterium]
MLVRKILNLLPEIDRLSNRYLVMRHGHSIANAQGIIVSHPENGCFGFGLSELGRSQVEQSLQQETLLGVDTMIVCSDFMRARESAEIAHSLLDCANPIAVEPRLRERNFGELELSADKAYADVWREDMANPDSCWRGVESVNQVMRRVTAVINELENRHANAVLLLVSHGDALQILQTAFARRAASDHRELEHLHTAEIRQLDLSLPDLP